MSTLVNKLATAAFIRADKQYSCQIRDIDSETEDLIQVLSLQTITQSKIRLTADDLESYRETNDLNFRETKSSILNESESNDLNVVKNKSSILSLIKEAQEFNSLCRQISSQLCEKLKRNFSFALTKNKILKKINHVFMS